MAKMLPMTTFLAGDVIFKEGDMADEAYLIFRGSVEISTGEGDEKTVIATLGDSAVFGEMPFLEENNGPRSEGCNRN